jgi:hypothetical protein
MKFKEIRLLPVGEAAIESKIYLIRGHKVILDTDLAILYGVQTFQLNQAVKRNAERFPEDFMFRLTKEEFQSLTSQSVMSKGGRGGRRHRTYVFTEQGVAMLSSVLRSDRAIRVNIAIMRTFARLKEILIRREDLAAKLKELEERIDTQDSKIVAIFNAIGRLINPKKPRPRIGFKPLPFKKALGHSKP